MQKLLKGSLLGFIMISAFLFASKSYVIAFEGSNSFGKSFGEGKKLAATSPAVVTNRATSASELKQTACETHVKVINLRQKNIIAHAERVQTRLGKLTTAVEKYYTEKLVSQGKAVANYDALVADAAAKEAALVAALDKVKADTDGLTCVKDQAKTQFTTFRTDMQSLLKTFKDYRLSVLQLMQAVKKVAGNSDADVPETNVTGTKAL